MTKQGDPLVTVLADDEHQAKILVNYQLKLPGRQGLHGKWVRDGLLVRQRPDTPFPIGNHEGRRAYAIGIEIKGMVRIPEGMDYVTFRDTIEQLFAVVGIKPEHIGSLGIYQDEYEMLTPGYPRIDVEA